MLPLNENSATTLDENSGVLKIFAETLLIIKENILKLLILLTFYAAIDLPEQHFKISLFDASFLGLNNINDIADIDTIALLEKLDLGDPTFDITFGSKSIFFILFLIAKLTILFSFLKIVHEDENVFVAILDETKEMIFFILDRIFTVIIIFSLPILIYFVILKTDLANQLASLSDFKSIIEFIIIALSVYYSFRFGGFLYQTICTRINYQPPLNVEIFRNFWLYRKKHTLSILNKFLWITTLVYLIQFLLSFITWPSEVIALGISASNLMTVVIDFFSDIVYIISAYLIFEIYKNVYQSQKNP